jgi:hypothetical protein
MLQSFKTMFKECYAAGIDWIMASGKKAQGINAFSVTLSGAAPHAVTFAANDCPNFADTNYLVIPHGETASRVTVDESSKTMTGFSLLSGVAGEVVHIICVGRLSGMPSQ